MNPFFLFKKCSNFNRLANLISICIIENNHPILKEISNEPSFNKRLKIASDNFEKIGEGSSRSVFYFSDDLVIKIAKNEKGIAQNKEESKPELQTEITSPVIAADPSGKWIIQKFANKIDTKRFEELSGINFDHLSDTIHYKFNNDSDVWKKPDDYEYIINSDIFNHILSLIACNDLQAGDITSIDSWGEADGKLVIMDYGLSRDIYDEFYS